MKESVVSVTRPCKRGNFAPRRASNRACLCPDCVAHAARTAATRYRRKKTDPVWLEGRRRATRERMRRNTLDPAKRTKRNRQNRELHAADPRGKMICSARARAKKLGVPFALAIEDVVLPTHCPALGILLQVGRGKLADGSPTLDRIIPEKGYTAGNVVVVSHLANRIKSNASVKQLRAVVDWAERL